MLPCFVQNTFELDGDEEVDIAGSSFELWRVAVKLQLTKGFVSKQVNCEINLLLVDFAVVDEDVVAAGVDANDENDSYYHHDDVGEKKLK